MVIVAAAVNAQAQISFKGPRNSLLIDLDEYGDTVIEKHFSAPQPDDSALQALVKHNIFRNSVNSVILVNAIQLGIAADIQNGAWITLWLICDHVFCTVFAVEMVLSIGAFRFTYFQNRWFVFDFVVAIISILDTWILPVMGLGDDVSFIKILRLLRLLRIVKLTRAIPEVTAIVEGLLNSMASMFWVVVLAFLMLYAFGICCVQVIGHSDSGYPSYSESDDDIHNALVDNFNNYIYFGTVFRSIYTLFGIVLLSEWSLIRPVAEVHPLFVPIFYLALILVTFGVLNVMIGIVVEKTTEAIQKLKAEKEDKVMNARTELCATLGDMLFDLDTNGDNTLSREEFEEGLKDKRLVRIIENIGLPPHFTSVELFNMLDVDGSGLISKHEFINGVVRLLHCNTFQRHCLLSMRLGSNLQSVKRWKADLFDDIMKGVKEVCREMKHEICCEILASQNPRGRGMSDAIPLYNCSSMENHNTVKLASTLGVQSFNLCAPQSNEGMWEPLPATTCRHRGSTDTVPRKDHQEHIELKAISESDAGGDRLESMAPKSSSAQTDTHLPANCTEPLKQNAINSNDNLFKVHVKTRFADDSLRATVPTDESQTMPHGPHELSCRGHPK